MPTIDERLAQVNLKVQRAKEHVGELERAIQAFIAGKPYEIGAEYDPKTRRPYYYVASVQPTPDSLPLIAGDAVQNLMSALDHLAYQLVCGDTGDNPPNPSRIYFPVADDATTYASNRGKRMQGANQDTIDAIDALKPYKGGNDSLWTLHRLNNIEKHRLLFTVGSSAAGVHLGQLLARTLGNGFPPEAVEMLKGMPQFLMPADKGFPLKPGFVLYRGAPDEKLDPKQEFRFSVALSEPGIIESQSLVQTLRELTVLVEGIVTALAPQLKGNA